MASFIGLYGGGFTRKGYFFKLEVCKRVASSQGRAGKKNSHLAPFQIPKRRTQHLFQIRSWTVLVQEVLRVEKKCGTKEEDKYLN